MMAQLLSSKVVIEEEEPRIRNIDAVQTSIAAMVGVTERGPVNVPTLVTSFDEYKQYFGGFTADSDVALAAQGFFENGGQFLYVVRVVHFTDSTDPNTKTSAAGTLNLLTAASGPTAGTVTSGAVEPFELTPGETLDIAVDGGGTQPVTFDAAAASVTSSNTETFALADGETLQFTVDGGSLQTVTFNTAEFVAIGAATAAEVAAVINAEATGIQADAPGGAVRITTDTVGTGASLASFGGTAAATLGFAAGDTGTGDVADITAVTAAEAAALINADVTGATASPVGGAVQIDSDTTGPSSSVQVEGTSTALAFSFDNATHSGTTGAAVNTLQVDAKYDGTYSADLTIQIAAATSGDSEEFNLVVLDDGLIAEEYPNLSMLDTADRYVESVINSGDEESSLISVIDLDAVVSSQRPANGTTGPLAGGDDGLVGLVDADFGALTTAAVGIQAMDEIQEFNILTVPGQTTSAVHNGMVTYCEDKRKGSAFPILESPAGSSATDIITYMETTAGLLGLSEFGAMYWPHVKVINPSESVFGTVETVTVPPAGHIAGIYARTDAAREGGVYDPPAGIEEGRIAGIVGFETDEVFDEAKRDLVYPKRINILTSFPGAPRHIDGSRCLKGGGNFPFVSQRRGAIFIEQSIKNGTEFARHKNNTAELRRTVLRTIRGFLLIQMRNKAFASQEPDKAFFVDLSDKLNTASVVNAGKMIGRIGLAFNTPAEFLVFRFSKDTRALESEILGG